MTDRPTGMVAFLFTDLEGSTRLWEADVGAMELALERHDQIVREALAAHDGYIFSTGGDGFGVAFQRLVGAVEAAGAFQPALGSERWPTERPLRVRAGIHVGEAQERDGDYFGPTVNRAARLMAAGHGGQTLVSDVASKLLVGGSDLLDLGEHRLKDLSAPQRIYQVGSAVFDPLRTLDVTRHNLPAQRTLLVARDEEALAVSAALADHRLVTLTGIGGIGKTRLSILVAAQMVDEFPDGVFLVELGAMSDGDLIASRVADVVGIAAADSSSRVAQWADIASRLAKRRLLLVLDNCEHVIDDAAEFVDLVLESGSGCRVLATSREALEIAGERPITVASLTASSGLLLLGDRAMAVREDLDLVEHQDALEEVVAALDGIPLAIELAAAQLDHLSPIDLLSRLENRFDLLTGGRRRGRQRQQTLTAMMDWSWSLLDDDERRLLAELSVFSGGWTLGAAEQVSSMGAGPTTEHLRALVAKSLVVTDESPVGLRFGLLETVRLYALQKLLDSGGADQTRDRHLAWVGRFAADVAVGIHSDDEPDWIRRVDDELQNIVVAADWALSSQAFDEAIEIFDHLKEEFFLRQRGELGERGIRLVWRLAELDDDRMGIVYATLFLLAQGYPGWVPEGERMREELNPDWDEIAERYPWARLTSAGRAYFAEHDPERAAELIAPLPDELVQAGKPGSAARIRAVLAFYQARVEPAEAEKNARRAVDEARQHCGPGGLAATYSFAAAAIDDPLDYLREVPALAERSRCRLAATGSLHQLALAECLDDSVPTARAVQAVLTCTEYLLDGVQEISGWAAVINCAIGLGHRRMFDGILEGLGAAENSSYPVIQSPVFASQLAELRATLTTELGSAEVERRLAIGRQLDLDAALETIHGAATTTLSRIDTAQ